MHEIKIPESSYQKEWFRLIASLEKPEDRRSFEKWISSSNSDDLSKWMNAIILTPTR